MYCWKCGQELRDDARFCFKCGAPTAGARAADCEKKTTPPVQVPPAPEAVRDKRNARQSFLHQKVSGLTVLVVVLAFIVATVIGIAIKVNLPRATNFVRQMIPTEAKATPTPSPAAAKKPKSTPEPEAVPLLSRMPTYEEYLETLETRLGLSEEDMKLRSADAIAAAYRSGDGYKAATLVVSQITVCIVYTEGEAHYISDILIDYERGLLDAADPETVATNAAVLYDLLRDGREELLSTNDFLKLVSDRNQCEMSMSETGRLKAVATRDGVTYVKQTAYDATASYFTVYELEVHVDPDYTIPG